MFILINEAGTRISAQTFGSLAEAETEAYRQGFTDFQITTLQDQKAALLRGRTTEQLILDLRRAEQMTPRTATMRMIGAWLADEIERRLPELSEVILGYMDNLEDERTYGQMIEDGIRQLAAQSA